MWTQLLRGYWNKHCGRARKRCQFPDCIFYSQKTNLEIFIKFFSPILTSFFDSFPFHYFLTKFILNLADKRVKKPVIILSVGSVSFQSCFSQNTINCDSKRFPFHGNGAHPIAKFISSNTPNTGLNPYS